MRSTFSDKHPTLVFLHLYVFHESELFWECLIVACSGFYRDEVSMQLKPIGEDIFHFKEMPGCML